jgi:hypothetical protein
MQEIKPVSLVIKDEYFQVYKGKVFMGFVDEITLHTVCLSCLSNGRTLMSFAKEHIEEIKYDR